MSSRLIFLVCAIFVLSLIVPNLVLDAVLTPNVLWWKFDEGSGTVVKDSTGKTAVVVNADPAATKVTNWTKWTIPLSDLAGVNLAKVKKLYIGVGDRENPVSGGGGRIYIDDIRVVKP